LAPESPAAEVVWAAGEASVVDVVGIRVGDGAVEEEVEEDVEGRAATVAGGAVKNDVLATVVISAALEVVSAAMVEPLPTLVQVSVETTLPSVSTQMITAGSVGFAVTYSVSVIVLVARSFLMCS
jgi:hypothetical protein